MEEINDNTQADNPQMFSSFKYEIKAMVAHIVLNHPEKRNCLTPGLLAGASLSCKVFGIQRRCSLYLDSLRRRNV